ncbi:hypothetical protein B0H17DRAFT_1190802 [Mycena rosella]|uniref:F-box domain-containing protein n=1 Tax=Mycena rosella TaxID=1033263 RepID=A0AAD7H186_MYCRO|nr:hypothetical protein B0H17DRAFT_1190802 [Mycena rosella]
MASHPRLPLDLTDQVILHSEPKALATCALVCRDWLPSSQRRLFSKLRIDEHNCAEIVGYLTSATPNLSNYVKHLYVFLWGDIRSNYSRTTANKSPLLPLLLPHISRFTNVKTLEFDGCRAFLNEHWDVTWTDLLAEALGPFIDQLTISYLTFEDLPDLVDLVSSFPQLTYLTANDLDIAEASHEYSNEDQEPYEGSKVPPPLLENLKYTSASSFGSGLGPFLSWLAAGPQVFNTLYLDLDAEAGDVNAGVDLIRAAGDNLTALFLAFDDQWSLWEGFEFSVNPNLRSLTLRRASDLGNSLVEILGSLKSVEHLSLGGVDEMDRDVWPGLVDVLTSPSFTSLVQVKFYVSSEDGLKDLASEIFEEYPDFFGKGITVFALKRHHEW